MTYISEPFAMDIDTFHVDWIAQRPIHISLEYFQGLVQCLAALIERIPFLCAI